MGCYFNFNSRDSSSITIDEVIYIVHDDTIQCKLLDNVLLKVSANNLSSIFLSAAFEEFNRVVGDSNLLKRSLLLIKAWCYYESRRFTALGTLKSFSRQCVLL